MAAQLPFPYPDELFYSVVARYLAYFSPQSTSSAIRAIIGKRWCSIGFGSELDLIARKTKDTWGMKSHEIVERHSLLPFYGAFFEPSVYLEIVQKMCAAGQTVLSGRGDLRHSVGLRYCPVCASEDVAKFGETYWHRRHQLPGAVMCTVHNQVLFLSGAPALTLGTVHHDATARIASDVGTECATLTQDERRLAVEIANRCVAVLNGECNKWTRLEVRMTYAQSVREHGFNVGTEKTDTALLTRRFIEFFGTDFLKKIGFRTGKFLFHNGGAKAPLANVLVQMFLENYVEDQGFAGLLTEMPLYGWKCPNEHAKHLDSFRVANVVRRKSRLGHDYFHAKCTCGFTFAFDRATRGDPLMPHHIVVSRWSPYQQKEAQALFARHLSVRAVASAMKLSHRTASKLIACEESKFKITLEEITKLRQDWERDRSRSTYQALLKHDRKWLREQNGQRVVGRLPVPVGRDGELASTIRAAFARIKNRGDSLTLKNLSQELGFRLVRSHLDDHPLSKAEVLTVCPIPPWLPQRKRRGWTNAPGLIGQRNSR